MTTTDLVPAENMAALEALPTADREVAVIRMLDGARGLLSHALAATDPREITEFKAQMATVAEWTKQLNLSKEIQAGAREMVRRAERGVGVAIREGQERGEIRRPGDPGISARPYTRVRLGTVEHIQPAVREPNGRLSPKEFVQDAQERVDIYALTDGVTDEVFEVAIAEAKAEGDLSRANLVRKVKSQPGPQSRQQRADIIRAMAAEGYSSRQMPAKVGVAEGTVRQIARDFDIEIPADKIIGRTRRLDSTHIVESTVLALEGAVRVVDLVELAELDLTNKDEWVSSLGKSLKSLAGFVKQLNSRS